MSKIFEVLQKYANPHTTAEETLMAAALASNPADVLSAPPNPASGSAPAPAAVSTAVPAPVTPAPPPVQTEPACFVGAHRTLPLRLAAKDPLMPFDARSRRSVEQYRVIRTKICHHPSSPKMVVVSSAGSGDGKTVTAINLAGVMSLKAGTRILLIDGDLRRSSVAKVLGLPPAPGLTDVITRSCSLEDALIRLEQFPNCFILPAGSRSENPPELLDSPNWHTLIAAARQSFDMIIVDTPPVGSVADYELLEAAADSVVMVVRPDHTRRAAFKKAMATVPAGKMLGIIINEQKDWFLWTVQGGYSYAYYDALDAMPQARPSEAAR